MTVRQNLAYPLKARGRRREVSSRVDEISSIVECEALLDRYPRQLSGGQQQRIALARGLIAQPEIMLFDEPLSNLDALLRQQVRGEIAELHERLKFTALYVTHDQSEALALGTRMAIMKEGKVVQIDTPQSIFALPATEYVAQFLGMSNRIRLERKGELWFVGSERCWGATPPLRRGLEAIVLRARSEDFHISAPGKCRDAGHLRLDGSVVVATFGGRSTDVVISTGGGQCRINASVPVDSSEAAVTAGTKVEVHLDPTKARAYEDSTGLLDSGGLQYQIAGAAS
jgi:iron(III) transport system ATP-binding protein